MTNEEFWNIADSEEFKEEWRGKGVRGLVRDKGGVDFYKEDRIRHALKRKKEDLLKCTPKSKQERRLRHGVKLYSDWLEQIQWINESYKESERKKEYENRSYIIMSDAEFWSIVESDDFKKAWEYKVGEHNPPHKGVHPLIKENGGVTFYEEENLKRRIAACSELIECNIGRNKYHYTMVLKVRTSWLKQVQWINNYYKSVYQKRGQMLNFPNRWGG